MKKLTILDCTLRDGGYVNDWNWGYLRAKSIIKMLTKAKVDVVEVGFLRNVEKYNPDITVCNKIEELNELLPENYGDTIYSGMAMRSNYDIKKLSPYSGKGIKMIRITAHDYDIKDGMEFARAVKDKGYLLSINPINIMGYSDESILWILKQVNEILPYQFSIVDTFGSMTRRALDRIVSLVDNNLDTQIKVGLHLHENMSLGCLLAQNFADKHLKRPIAIDGSLMGMGRIPGNLPIELLADYFNEYYESCYDIDYLMDAIQDYIEPIKGLSEWGYTPAYFLSARYNLHRNYAEYYLKKGDLTHRDINHILSIIDNKKKTAFDEQYANQLYLQYKNNIIDDRDSILQLKKLLSERDILIIAPGATVMSHREVIREYIDKENPIVISLNFTPPEELRPDYVFCSNAKRYEQIDNTECPVIITSNIKNVNANFIINYNDLTGTHKDGTNSFIMLVKLLKILGASKISAAGADGYKDGQMSYYDRKFHDNSRNGQFNNAIVKESFANMGIKLNYITPSSYRDE